MPFLLAEILNFQGSTHFIGVGSFSYLHSATFIYNYLLFPQQMRDVECDAYEVSGVTFSANANAYEPAKQQLYIRSDIVLRGKDIRDGFRYNYH